MKIRQPCGRSRCGRGRQKPPLAQGPAPTCFVLHFLLGVVEPHRMSMQHTASRMVCSQALLGCRCPREPPTQWNGGMTYAACARSLTGQGKFREPPTTFSFLLPFSNAHRANLTV